MHWNPERGLPRLVAYPKYQDGYFIGNDEIYNDDFTNQY